MPVVVLSLLDSYELRLSEKKFEEFDNSFPMLAHRDDQPKGSNYLIMSGASILGQGCPGI